MLFQLVLSDTLRTTLNAVAQKAEAAEQPAIHGADINRMAKMPNYSKDATADNVMLFHGREVRKVPTAAGGMGFVLQLTAADLGDPEGWTAEEIAGYDGWGHDASRTWRKGEMLESEGYKSFRSTFGTTAFTLNHRFYFHLDAQSRFWLSAEDGCEGFAAK